MDIDIEEVLRLQQRVDSLKRYVNVLKFEKGELEAEISRHHADFLRIRKLLDDYEKHPCCTQSPFKAIRNIVG